MKKAEETAIYAPWALAALMSVLGALLAVHFSMARVIRTHILEFDVYPFPEKLIGLALQRQAFVDASLLPVYGSSELTQPQANRADDFFARRPTGFGTFLIGNPGETCLIIATKLAALGGETRGKRVVVFLSPGWFLEPELDHKGFGVNFSPLHGNVIAFQSALSASLKADLARRLLAYPETVGQSVLLRTALCQFAEPTPTNAAIATALFPAGWAQTALQRNMEDVRLCRWWRGAHPSRVVEAYPDAEQPRMVDWDELRRNADSETAKQPKLTAYSVGPQTPYDVFRESTFRDSRHPEMSPDANFARACAASKEWTDLELLWRVAREKKIRLLVVCQPLNANFARRQGLSDRSSTMFYDRLRQVSERYNTRLATFPKAETDAGFYQDSAHPSGKGWLTYDAALDAFYHERADEAQSVIH